MELATGGELLDKILNTGNFSEKRAANLMRKMLSAI